jgi:hypothetical protein
MKSRSNLRETTGKKRRSAMVRRIVAASTLSFGVLGITNQVASANSYSVGNWYAWNSIYQGPDLLSTYYSDGRSVPVVVQRNSDLSLKRGMGSVSWDLTFYSCSFHGGGSNPQQENRNLCP